VNVHLNGELRLLADGATIADLLAILQLDARYLAVEVNRRVVPRAEHRQHVLRDGDQLEIVTLVGGG
jgi:thiamine biosynthesis protein ThiS